MVEHGWPSGARVSRYPTAGSHHSYGVDSTTRQFCANCIMKVVFNDCQASNQWRSGDRDDREVRDGKKIWKVPARWSALYSASHWHSSWEPRLVLRAKESNNQKVWRRIKQSKSHKYHYPIPLVFRIKTIKNPGKSREMGKTAASASPGRGDTTGRAIEKALPERTPNVGLSMISCIPPI